MRRGQTWWGAHPDTVPPFEGRTELEACAGLGVQHAIGEWIPPPRPGPNRP